MELVFQFTSSSLDRMTEGNGQHSNLKLQKQLMKLEFAPGMVLNKIETSTCSRDSCVF